MTPDDDPVESKIQTLRGQLVELASTIRKLDQSGLGSARAQLVLSRKRAELEDLIKRDDGFWHRRFDFKGGSMDAPPQAPNFIGDRLPTPATDPLLVAATRTISAAREMGREKFRERLTASFGLKQFLLSALCRPCLARALTGRGL